MKHPASARTHRQVARLPTTGAPYTVRDADLRGHYIRISAKGSKSFVAVARNPDGKQVWTTIGRADTITIEKARETARDVMLRVKEGLGAFEPPAPKPLTFGDVAATWMARHVEKTGLLSAKAYGQVLDRHVLPHWRDRAFAAIRRSDVADLLDHVQDGAGTRTADYTLALVRAIMNWQAARADDYQPPIARGMRRSSGGGRARILDDAELRVIWQAADGTFGAIVKILLLTAQRREKVLTMRWVNIAGSVWTVPTAPREKGTGGSLELPAFAMAIIEAMPRYGRCPYVFASRRTGGHFNSAGPGKRKLDQQIDLPRWTLHDLRRTARSLMARAGVRPDIAERVLGHAIRGVEGVYDRHQCRAEKADALRRLAGLIERIVQPQENVIALRS